VFVRYVVHEFRRGEGFPLRLFFPRLQRGQFEQFVDQATET
jgi:hypothetical protein